MSILFGLLEQHGEIVAGSDLELLGTSLEKYGTGPAAFYVLGRFGMGVYGYPSHERSVMERGPAYDAYGHAVSFDGRLDNYKELCGLLDLQFPDAQPDSQIVLAAFRRWGEGCFSRFVGDWAISLWSGSDQSLYLARDHAGARTLYFCCAQGQVTWATYLDAFQPASSGQHIAEDYAARYLACRPIRDLTPYQEIRAVPPAHVLRFQNGVAFRAVHWNSTVKSTIRYRSDAEYETHFLELFTQAVERRTGPGAPVLAQLSGGMDSTAIVCTSDHLRRLNNNAEILDTVSYYDDSEASLNERPYFSITEAKRGKVGTHLDIAFSQRTFRPHDGANGIYLLPGADSFTLQQERNFQDAVWGNGYRSILSGIGGDEVLGGVPNPLPELAGYLVSGSLLQLIHQSVAWSLTDRIPLIETLYRTASYAFHLYARPGFVNNDIPPWISCSLQKRCHNLDADSPVIRTHLGVAPYRLDNSLAWWSVMETLPHLFPQLLARPEYRYPFLDKDLVDYLFSIPREQVLRPGRRRSLMRRALVNIVPNEILERRRKAYQLRAPLRALQQASGLLDQLFADSLAAQAGFIEPGPLRKALRRTADGDSAWWQALLKTIAFELWLESTFNFGNVREQTRQGAPRPLSLIA